MYSFLEDVKNVKYNSYDMSIIQKYLTNRIVGYEIIIVLTPYCPTHVLNTCCICKKESIY